MAPRLRINTREFGELADDARRAAGAAFGDVLDAVRTTAGETLGSIRQRAPKTTGSIASSFRSTGPGVETGGTGIRIVETVFSDRFEAVVVASGRAAGEPAPPVDALVPWIEARWTGPADAAAIRSAAFVAARTIARRGIPPNAYVEGGIDVAVAVLNREVDRIVDELARELEA